MNTKLALRHPIISIFIKSVIAFIVVLALFTTITIQLSGDSTPQIQLPVINDITQLNPVTVKQIVKPHTEADIISAIVNTNAPISIGGGHFSQGGQTAYEGSIHLDMREYNDVIDFQPDNKLITVESGITWRDIQKTIDPSHLSIRIMQTYADFTVGGSLSVNAHGRYIGQGPLVSSVKRLKLVIADGSVIEASPEQNAEIFYGVIGGYGGLGVISEVTLSLTDNVRVERIATPLPVTDYYAHFKNKVRNNSKVIFHNADLYPPDYEQVLDVSWYETDKPLTIHERLIPKDTEYLWGPITVDFVAGSDFGKKVRQHVIDPLYYKKPRVVWRNWEASYDVRELEPDDRAEETYVLREYFVPVDKFDQFVEKMREIFQKNDVNVVNVSIRHAHKDPGTLLAWAREESFAFVVYYLQGTDEESKEGVKKWSKEMIDAVIGVNGSYYLPYQIYASSKQFHAAYPQAAQFFTLKRKLDPEYRFRNQLWREHYPQEHLFEKEKAQIEQYYRAPNQTLLTIPEWYLVFNPLEYSQFLRSGKNPSDFPFLGSIDEYWTLYDKVIALTDPVYPENGQYKTMLQVIGISTTVEYLLKGIYENTVGRLTHWLASNTTEEDQIITDAQTAYSDFIFEQAWYQFDFWSWVKTIWRQPDFFGKDFVRKTERKVFFTLEFGFKTIYAKLIGFAAQSAYEQSDGHIYLTLTGPQPDRIDFPESVKIITQNQDELLLSVPRWGGFTRNIPKLAGQGYRFIDISGNKNIAVSVIANAQNETTLFAHGTPLFQSRIVSNENLTRYIYLITVSDLAAFIKNLAAENIYLEHIYDY